MNNETGGPAFPGPSDYGIEGNPIYDEKMYLGMTLRDYFAAKAMQSMCYEVSRYDQFLAVAKDAYKMADAMLEARK